MKLTEDMLRQHAAEARDLWLSTLPQEKEVPSHTFSRRFERKLRKLRAEQRRSPRMNRIVHVLRYAAACAAVVLCIGGTAYAYRVGVIDALIQTCKEYTSIQYSSDTTAEDAKFPESTLTYIPDGMVEVDSGLEETQSVHHTHLESSDGSTIDLDEFLITEDSNSTQIVDSEDADTKHFSIEDTQATLYKKDNFITITWSNNSVSYTLTTYLLSENESKKIALGVHQKNN